MTRCEVKILPNVDQVWLGVQLLIFMCASAWAMNTFQVSRSRSTFTAWDIAPPDKYKFGLLAEVA